MMRVYRATGLATVILTNATGFNVSQCLDAVDSQFVGQVGRLDRRGDAV
jgi:hypothetical protein